MSNVDELKKIIINQKVVIGTNQVIKRLKQGALTKVFVASNCPEHTMKDILHYTNISKIDLVTLDVPNSELGIICKKPFFVSTIGVLK
ncbi:MAG: ribosomal L7Ae/L30e/S12e/Gadd45 family protein [Candidatus Woesearchaeota archaeon]